MPCVYILHKYLYNIPDKELLRDLRKTAKKLGKNYVTNMEYKKEGKFSPWTIALRFGSWNAAHTKAGLKVNWLRKIPTDELMRNLKNIWDSLGRQPSLSEITKPLSLYGRSPYLKRFGTWQNTLETFIRCVNEKENTVGVIENKYRKPHKLKVTKKINRKISKGMRYDILTRDNYRCKCGASPATDQKVRLHVDHIIPLSKGGETILKNLQTLCSDCNLGKGTKSLS